MDGVELRDWFAGMALQALIGTTAHSSASGDLTSGDLDNPESIASDARTCGWGSETNLVNGNGGKYTWLEIITAEAYEFADSMMERRNTESR